MPIVVTRLILALSALFGAGILYIALFALTMRSLRDAAFLLAGVVSGLAFAAAWTWIWAREVHWDSRRVSWTAAVGGLALAAAVVVGFALTAMTNEEELGMVLGAMVWVVVWMGGTAWAWRETPADRVERLQRHGIRAILCPNCGYNLTGLKQAVCPECGAEYTLDQLFAAMADEREKVG